MAQKLSLKAARAKAVRDKKAAMTPARRAKKAHAQRERRKCNPGPGWDWDHEDGRWERVSRNRGNEGNGTKSEGKKKYKVPSGTQCNKRKKKTKKK